MKCAILISLFNSDKTLDQTFESLKAQTFQNFRIVAINDGSRDRTFELLKRWQEKFGQNRFLLIDNKVNIGLTKSLNKGLRLITEPFTARIDADDRWHPEKLEKQIAFLETHADYEIVGCNYVNRYQKKEVPVYVPKTDEEIKKSILRRNPFAHSCVVFRTESIKKIGGYDENIRYGQDYELWLRCSPLMKFHNLQEFLCFRNAENGISFDKQNEQMIQCFKTQIRYIRILQRSPLEYRFLIEPLLVLIAPLWLKQLKRTLDI